jgi:hypothetical protein
MIIYDYNYTPRERDWAKTPGINKIRGDIEDKRYDILRILESISGYHEHFKRIPINGDPNGSEPMWANDWFPRLDAASLYGLLVKLDPSVYLEVGSGYSTKFARRAIVDHNLKTKIISIDPEPRADIDRICDQVIRNSLENIQLDFVEDLPGDSLIFIDSSHRSFQNSDVTVFFTEMLPLIPKGATWGLHDTFLPYDYPTAWLTIHYLYNEQYLLAAYLIGGGGPDKILLPNTFILRDPFLNEYVNNAIFKGDYFSNLRNSAACFWMQRS